MRSISRARYLQSQTIPAPSTCGCFAARCRWCSTQYDYRFELGKAKVVRPGTDVLFVSAGLMTMRVLEAAAELEKDGISAAVLHSPTIKPLDEATILAEAGKGGRLVIVAENHSVIGGLGEAVAAMLLRNDRAPKFRHIGLPDEFLDAGALPTLHERYGISTSAITSRTKAWLA